MQFENLVYICSPLAGVVELVDTLDLGSSAARCGSSSLPARTDKGKAEEKSSAFFVQKNMFFTQSQHFDFIIY